MQWLLWLLLVGFLAPSLLWAQEFIDAGEENPVQVTSTYTAAGLDFRIDANGNVSFVENPASNVVSFSGLNGLTSSFVLTPPAGSNASAVEFTVTLSNIKYYYTTQTQFWVPYKGGQVIIDSSAELEDVTRDDLNDIIQRYLEEGVVRAADPSRRRKRSAEEEEEEKGKEKEKRDGRDGKDKSKRQRTHRPLSRVSGPLAPRSTRRQTDRAASAQLAHLLPPGLDPEDLQYHVEDPESHLIEVKEDADLSLEQKLLLLKQGRFTVQVRNDPQGQRKRSVIGAISANQPGTKEFLDEMGGNCALLKYGVGIIPGAESDCLLKSVTYLDQQIGEVSSRVDSLDKQMGLVVDTLDIVSDSLTLVEQIQEKQGEQIDLLQSEIDILRDSQVNDQLKFQDVAKLANSQAFATEMLQASDSKLASSVQRLEAVMDGNFRLVNEAMSGLGDMVNENIVALQTQLLFVEQKLEASATREIKELYLVIAQTTDDIHRTIKRLAVDMDTRMAKGFEDLAGAIDEARYISYESQEQIRRIHQVLEDLYAFETEIVRLLLYRGDAAIAYWIHKRIIEQADGGIYMPLVLEGTGKPPPNLTAYTAIGGKKLDFVEFSPTTCQATANQLNQAMAEIDAVVKENALIRTLIPLKRHPAFAHYSFLASSLSTAIVQNLQYFLVTVAAVVNGGPLFPSSRFAIPIANITPSNPCGVSLVPDTPANRANPSRIRFFLGAETQEQLNSGVVRDGDRVHLATFVGTTLCKLGPGNPTLTPYVGSISPYFVRKGYATAEEGRLSYMRREPIGATEDLVFYQTNPSNPDRNRMAAVDVSNPPQMELNGWILQAIRFGRDNFDGESGSPATLLTQPETNATATGGFATPRARRSITPAPSFTDCYEGISIETSYPSTFLQMSAAAQTRATQCSAKPGCQYVVALEPTVLLAFETADFGGKVQALTPSYMQTVNFGSVGFKSIIVPPALSLRVYTEGNSASKCAEYTFSCKHVVMTDPSVKKQCLLPEEVTQLGAPAGFTTCNNFYGPSVGDQHPWTDERESDAAVRELNSRKWNGYAADGRPNICQGHSYHHALMACTMRDTPNNHPSGADKYRSTTGSTTPAAVEQCKRRLSGGTKYLGSLSTLQEPASNSRGPPYYYVYTNVEAYNFVCMRCLPGYGSIVDGSASPDGSCNPSGFNASSVFGGSTGPFFYRVQSNLLNVPIRSERVPTDRSWHSCQPYSSAVTGATSAANKFNDYSLPYFFTPGDLSTGSYKPPAGVNILLSIANCSVYTIAQCAEAEGTRVGFCSIQLDPALTTPSAIPSLVQAACRNVADDPCTPLTSIDACLAASSTQSSGKVVPLCQWKTSGVASDLVGTCQALQATSVGSDRVYPSPSSNYPVAAIHLPCAYRDPTLVARCAFDGRCFHVESLSAGSGVASECRPLGSQARATLEATNAAFVVSSVAPSQSAALSFLQSAGVDVATCLPQALSVQCNLRDKRWTLRLYAILNVARGLSADSGSQCSAMSGFRQETCSTLLLQQDGAYTGPVPTQNHGLDNLVPLCVTAGGGCRQNCHLYDRDIATCLSSATDDCFVDATTLLCHQSTAERRAAICPGNPSSPFGTGSNCVGRGNACNLFSGTAFVLESAPAKRAPPTVESVPDITSWESVEAGLAQHVCAKIAGADTGDFAYLAPYLDYLGAPRNTAVFPSFLSRACTLEFTSDGSFLCSPSALVGFCSQPADYCDLNTNLGDQLADMITQQRCSSATLGACLTETQDNVNFPCAWVASSDVFGYCTYREEAATLAYQFPLNKIRSWTFESYRAAEMVVAANQTGTFNWYTSVGLLPSTFKVSRTSAYSVTEDVLVIGPIEIPCNTSTGSTRGPVCCVDKACSNHYPNPLHPKNLWIAQMEEICQANSIDAGSVKTEIIYACKQKGYNSTTGEELQAYVCEGFVTDLSLGTLFTFTNPTERGRERVVLDPTHDPQLTPLHYYPTGGVSPSFRPLVQPGSFTLLNTVFLFDGLKELTAVSVANAREFTEANVTDSFLVTTQAELNSLGGIYLIASAASSGLQKELTSDIRRTISAKQAIYGPNPQAWDTREDYGATPVFYPAGTGPNGEALAKRDRIFLAYASRAFDVQVERVIDAPRVEATATIAFKDGRVLESFAATVDLTDRQGSVLLPKGYTFIHQTVGDQIVSIGGEHIGQGEPFQIGYVYSQTKTDSYNFTENFRPDFNAAYANRYPYLYQSAVIPGAVVGSPEDLCGNNIVLDPGKFSDTAVRTRYLELNLNFAVLTAEQQLFWRNALDRYGLEALERMDVLFKSLWVSLGCVNQLVNYVEGLIDVYRVWALTCFNQTSITFDRTCLTAEIRNNFVRPQNRVQCGNCKLVTNSDGSYATSYPGLAVCNPAYGTTVYTPPTKLGSIDSERTASSAFCLASSFYKITFEQSSNTTRTVVFELLPGQAESKAQFSSSLLIGSFIKQVTTSTLCPIFRNATAQPTAGVYRLVLRNPYPYSLAFSVRVRENSTWLDTASGYVPSFEDPCNRDESFSAPAFSELSLAISICAQRTYALQAFSLEGSTCSPKFEGTLDYTAVLANATATIEYVESSYGSAIINASKNVAESIGQIKESIEVELNATKVELGQSIFYVNSTLVDLAQQVGQLINDALNQNSSIVNLDGRVTFVEREYVTINSSLTDISQEQALIADLVEQIRLTTERLQNATQETINQLNVIGSLRNNVSQLSAEVDDLREQLRVNISNINAKIDTLYDVRAQELERIQGITDEQAAASSWVTWVIVAVAIVLVLAVAGFLIYYCVMGSKTAQAAKLASGFLPGGYPAPPPAGNYYPPPQAQAPYPYPYPYPQAPPPQTTQPPLPPPPAATANPPSSTDPALNAANAKFAVDLFAALLDQKKAN